MISEFAFEKRARISSDRAHLAHIDTDKQCLPDPIETFTGWFASVKEGLPILMINDQPQAHVRYFERPDVAEMFGEGFAVGWALTCDMSSVMSVEQRSLTLEVVRGRSVLARRHYRCVHAFPDVAKRTTYFMHLPKTGGTSLRMELEKYGSGLCLLPVYSDDLGFVSIDQFKSFSSTALSKIDVVYGHFNYGLHVGKNRGYNYVAVLRDPFDLVKSYYFYLKYGRMNETLSSCDSIFDAIDGRMFLDNMLTRALAGVPDTRSVSPDDLAAAIDNIDRDFAFVGIFEMMHATVERLSRYFGCQLKNSIVNATPLSREQELLDMVAFRRSAVEIVGLDLRLYEYVLQRFWGAGRVPVV